MYSAHGVESETESESDCEKIPYPHFTLIRMVYCGGRAGGLVNG
jgi:hypothetical protein